MKTNGSGLLDVMCAAVEIKEKMQALYEEAAGKCANRVGTETFEMLRDMERNHLEKLRPIYGDVAKGTGDIDSCRFYDFEPLNRSEILKRIRRKHKDISKACLDDVAAIESGLDLENKSIEFFLSKLKEASSPLEREFLTNMLAEERSHYILLTDLKFYYIDTGHWLMEKARTGLDGA